MRDEDRADKLARAIEEMVQGGLPEDLGDEELKELLQIARIRLDAARMATQTGAETQEAELGRLTTRPRPGPPGERPAISEQHREAVWQRVQARIGAHQGEKSGLVRWPLQRRDREAEYFGAVLDRMILGEPIWEAADSRLEELLRVAPRRRASTLTETAGLTDQSARVWSRLRPRLMARLMGGRRPGGVG